MPPPLSAKPLFFYTDSTYFSGAEKAFGILIETCRAHGHDVQLFCTPGIRERFEAFLPAGQIIGTVTRSKFAVGQFRQLRHLFQSKKEAVVIINMWSPYANTVALLAARLAKVPSISIYHYYQEKNAVTGVLRPIKLWAYRLGQRLATYILTVSEAHKTVLLQQFAFPTEKVGVLHNSVAYSETPDYTDHTPRQLLTVGSLEPAKGYAFLLTQLATCTVPFHLTMVGDGPERNHLETLAEALNHSVTFTGPLTSVEEMYTTHDVLLQPSHFENLSMAILEAMAHGLTVIANDVGGNRELVSEKEGWLLPLEDAVAWQHALTAACTMPLTDKRQAARARWQEQFMSEEQYSTFMDIIEKLS